MSWWRNEHDPKSMFYRLCDGRIVDFQLMPADGTTYLEVEEQCDEYFSMKLSKQQAQQLVDELQELVNKM